MSERIGISDLLSSIGSDNIKYQYISQSMEGIKVVRGVTVVSFATDAITPNDVVMDTGPRGIVLWVDNDIMKQKLSELKSGSVMTLDNAVKQRNELLDALESVINSEATTISVSIYNEVKAAIAKAKGGA